MLLAQLEATGGEESKSKPWLRWFEKKRDPQVALLQEEVRNKNLTIAASAQEIERLRLEVERLETLNVAQTDETKKKNGELQAEIKTLKHAVTEAQEAAARWERAGVDDSYAVEYSETFVDRFGACHLSQNRKYANGDVEVWNDGKYVKTLEVARRQ